MQEQTYLTESGKPLTRGTLLYCCDRGLGLLREAGMPIQTASIERSGI